MPRRIVVGLDGSAESMAAAVWAAREASRRGFPLRLVHCWGWHPQLRAPLDVEARTRAERTVREAEARIRAECPDVALSAENTTDPTVPVLLHHAERSATLVLGSSGHGAVSGFLLGSVGQQVLAHALSPVVMVRANAYADRERDGADVVVAVHALDRTSGPLLRFAFATADARGAAVRVVHTWNVPSAIRHDAEALRLVDEDGGAAEREERALAKALRRWRRRFPRLQVVEQVERGDPGEALLRAAPDAALMVLGRKVRRPVLGIRLGPVAHDVLHHVPVPVAVVPH